MMYKKEARRMYNKKRLAITPQEKIKWDDLLLIQFQKVELPFLSTLLSFYPLEEKNEVNTFIITDFLLFQNPGLKIAYPKANPKNHSMEALLVSDAMEFANNLYNIPEPVSDVILQPDELDLVLVPLLICDRKGNRVGYGKGFYDRYLSQCRADCLRIGFSYFEPIEEIEDSNEFDVPLNLCITPQQVYVF